MAVSPEQLDALVTRCIGFARTMLEDAGDFYPFGATLTNDGKLGNVGGYNGEERPNPHEIYTLLGASFAADAAAGRVSAAALAANVNIPAQYLPSSPDGLRVHLEAEGFSRFIYVPYRITRRGFLKKRTVAEFDESFAIAVPPQFFRTSND